MKTTDQQILPGLAVEPKEKPLSLAPVSGREEPALWVSKLAVYKSWPPSKETLLRQVIELRRGLNILWAKPTGSTDEASRLAGHGAGKTTFCRLIRYVLGEEPAGSKAFRDAFKDKFQNGWVLAEVFAGGSKWLVGRPLSQSGHHPFAKLAGSLDDTFPESPVRTGFKEYQDAIDAAVFGKMTFRTLSDSQQSLNWPRLLPWLSRDQEAHFSGLLEWRNKDSDSESPYLSHEDKANLIRLILGLVHEKEQELLADYAAKAQAHEQKTRDRPKMEFAVERERLKLEAVLGMKVETPDAPLLQQEVDKKVAQLHRDADQALATVKQNEEIDRLMGVVSQCRADWGVANAMIEEWEEALGMDEARLNGVQPPAPKKPAEKDPFREALKGLGPFPGYCSHPMDKAWEHQCPIAQERPKEDEITEATKEIAVEANPLKAKVLRTKAELERRRLIAAPKKQALADAESALTQARQKHRQYLESLKAPSRDAANIEALLESYRTASSDLQKWDKALQSLAKQKEALNATLIELTGTHEKLMGQFTRIFNYVAQRMLGTAVTGKVAFSGKSILPELEYHGPRDSAALKVVRWLAFDIAALALGMTDSAAYHPRFLIHDSPREADLAASIYTSLFTTARDMEGPEGTQAPFQYIVTTTEAPPETLNQKPWLLDPVLDASVEGMRLLGVNL